ncbi:uncharacterized protein ddias [Anoplopoma fimbria]|uniref:uncharacterized protein ddias n=1 Tax=Anoplopoma fimbria TaxID=229290 RepID=UPI0023EB4256|nr:uncharacterized protein ddias [Anoplopoma fimbria]
MPVRRALVHCVVLSLQDACVFYPCCRDCFSRIDAEQQDTTRFRCSKCGYSCLREQVDYRYRLSLRVARDSCIFGVTVFGACLNPFFGIHARGLQRMVENLDGASTRSTLLMKAVEDCFIGRHFIFGIKVTETESRPWLGVPVANGSSSKEAVHFIASQMILPKAMGLGGCTVVSYYQTLLQKAAEYELGSTDPSKTFRPPATLLLIPHHFPASSFNNSTLSASGLLSQSPQRSQYQDGTLTPTPPWEQSLGLITSSAEQEEGCSILYSGDENSKPTENKKTPHHPQRGCLENHKVTEEKALSPLLALECSTSSSPSFAKYPCSSTEKAVGNAYILNAGSSPPPPGHNISKEKDFSTRKLTQTFLSSSLAWEDLPFSESLSEFLCEDNKHFDSVGETEPHLNVQNRKETRSNLEITSQDKNFSHKSTSVCQSNTQITDSQSQILQDITNTPVPNGGDRHGLTDRIYKTPVGCAFRSQARNICSHECNKEDEKALSLSSENEEEQLEVDTYNCSADLFSSSLIIDVSTNKLNTHAETVRTTTEARPLLPTPNKQRLRGEKETHSTPDKRKRKNKKCINRDGLIPTGTQDLDFIPPSQSTPIVKAADVRGSPASSYRNLTLAKIRSPPDCQDSCAVYGNLPEFDSKRTASSTSSLCKLSCVSKTSTRESHRFTPERRFWKPDEHKKRQLAQQHPRVQRGAPKTGSTGRISRRCNSSNCDVTVYDYEDNEVDIPPTPAAETRLSVKLRRTMQSGNSSSNLGYSREGQQGDGVYCKRTLLDRTLTSSQRGVARTENCDSKTVEEGSLDGSHCNFLDDENEACDWSRDLFSDSI